MSTFMEAVRARQSATGSLLCIGLDPDVERIAEQGEDAAETVLTFNRAIIDATADYACAYKPQFAHYAALGIEGALEATISYLNDAGLPVLLDAKRGDVGSTAERYAVEAFDRYNAGAVTINPYLGLDAMQPYLDRPERGVFILCRTSNPGAAAVQNLPLGDGGLLYQRVAALAAGSWNANANVGLVVGATAPSELAEIRDIVGTMMLLVPGIGAQGGDIAATVRAGGGADMMMSSSRGILYAGEGAGQIEAARGAARATFDEINRHRNW